MSNRMDLEARLRALRADPKQLAASFPSVPAAKPVLPTVAPGAPDVSPSAASSAPQIPAVGRRHSSFSQQPPSSPPHAPLPSPAQAQLTPSSLPAKASQRSLKRRDSCGAMLFGPDYDKAIQLAQRAIENERQRNIHTAIDAYIQAGQLLVQVGKKQDAVELQEVLKKKALALLERAEKLSAWVSEVQTRDSSVDALAKAFANAQLKQDEDLSAKEAQVSQLKSQNGELMDRLSQLTGITKAKNCFRRMLARKREEKRRKNMLEVEASAMMTKQEEDQQESMGLASATDAHARIKADRVVADQLVVENSQDYTQKQADSGPPEIVEKKTQKRQLINELHQRIGLPEIDHFRSFKVLGVDAWRDQRQQQLEDELEQARSEAEMLRSAVQRMETQLAKSEKKTAEWSEQEKLAMLNSELAHVREQLAFEKERNQVLEQHQIVFSDSDSDGEVSDGEIADYEDLALVMQLRQSLRDVGGSSSTQQESGPASTSSNSSTASKLSPRKRRSTFDGEPNGMTNDGVNALASPKRRQTCASTNDGVWI